MYHLKHIAKLLIPTACFMTFLLSMTACGVSPDTSAEVASAAVTATAEPEASPVQTSAPQPAETTAPPAVESASTATFTLEDAKALALADAGISEDTVTFLKATQDYENGISVYDIEFQAENTEYDYEIETATGEIHNKKVEAHQFGATKSDPSAAQLSEDDAKAVALEHAGVSESDVTWIQSKLERDDGQPVYDIEFRSGDMEYEYEVHSETGEILKSGWERR